ncbi:hypothetical protein HPL003_15540 [Paenibacillus terrae HPL-003]|jgi:hypothetical protein|uniref:Uncharacterized protein n=1 Tax=Paenibacillus terrae (strain HPL-003) TaxID=985665 RepID=G7VXU6_PAETH|nr:hypothetical protein HPL003_15540 [Paenibacillus terrae HPL-003]
MPGLPKREGLHIIMNNSSKFENVLMEKSRQCPIEQGGSAVGLRAFLQNRAVEVRSGAVP